MKNIMLFFVMVITLTSCSLLSPVKVGPEHAYVLTATCTPVIKRNSHLTLLVLPIESNDLYNTALMAYTNKPYQLSYFSKNGWAEPPAKMLQPLLIQTLQNTHFFGAVTTFPAHYDYALSVQLLELKQNFLCLPSTIQLKLRAQLISASTNAIVTTKQFSLTRLLNTIVSFPIFLKAAQEVSPIAGIMRMPLTEICKSSRG